MKNLLGFITDKQNRKFIIYIATTILVMIAIFLFSAQNGEESSALSGRVEKILRWLLGETLVKQWLTGVWINVRKFAHVFIYATLAFFAFHSIISAPDVILYLPNRKKKVLFVLVFCLLYACTDEFHQTFVPGRAGSIKDVCVDAVGFVPVTLILSWLKR